MTSSWLEAPPLVPEELIDHQRWAWMLKHMNHETMKKYLPPGWRPVLPGIEPPCLPVIQPPCLPEVPPSRYPIVRLTQEEFDEGERVARKRYEKKKGRVKSKMVDHVMGDYKGSTWGCRAERALGNYLGLKPNFSVELGGDGRRNDLHFGGLSISVKHTLVAHGNLIPAGTIHDNYIALVRSPGTHERDFELTGWTTREGFYEKAFVRTLYPKAHPEGYDTLMFLAEWLSPVEELKDLVSEVLSMPQ